MARKPDTLSSKSHHPIITGPKLFRGENAQTQHDGRASSSILLRIADCRVSGREMGHLRRLRIDVQIGSPFTQRCSASDTLHLDSREHEQEEEEEGKKGNSPLQSTYEGYIAVQFSIQYLAKRLGCVIPRPGCLWPRGRVHATLSSPFS